MFSPEIDIYAIGSAVWRQRRAFFAIWGAMIVLTIAALHFVSPKYTVSMSVAPVAESNSQISGSLGALAKLGGVNINGAGGQSQFHLFVEGLTTRNVADMLATDQGLMHRLFYQQWDFKNSRWRAPGIVGKSTRLVAEFLGIPVAPWHPPSGEQIYDILTNQLQIDDDPTVTTVALRLQSPRPEVARELLLKLTKNVDDVLRVRALNRANGYISYLTAELNKITVADYRAALLDRLAQQEQTRMMASANSISFSAETFSGPAWSVAPTAPKSVLILFFVLFGGGIFSAIIAAYLDRRTHAPTRPISGRRPS